MGTNPDLGVTLTKNILMWVIRPYFILIYVRGITGVIVDAH